MLELPDRLYSISEIQVHFEYIIKKTMKEGPITHLFKYILTELKKELHRFHLEILTFETIELIGGKEKKSN